MTDKEQIIIDGVDVKNCKGIDLSLSPLVKCKSLKFKTSDGGIAGIWCSDHTNCYFKQLARKTQECEELKSENFTREELISIQEKDIASYRKALEEIETVTKINCEEICGRKFTDCKDTSCFSVSILDITNKAKDVYKKMSTYTVTPSPTCSSVDFFCIVCDTYYQARDVQQQLLSNYGIISIVDKVEM